MESNVIIDYSKLLGDICTDIFSYIQPYAIWMVAILIVVCGVTFMLLRSWSRALLVALFAVYMFMVVVITILSREPHLDIYTVKLRSFETFTGSYNSVKWTVENILMFVPFGIFFKLIFRRSNIFFVFSAGLLCSFGIEYTQYYTNRGSFEVDDLMTNTIGALIGYLVVAVVYAVVWIIGRLWKGLGMEEVKTEGGSDVSGMIHLADTNVKIIMAMQGILDVSIIVLWRVVRNPMRFYSGGFQRMILYLIVAVIAVSTVLVLIYGIMELKVRDATLSVDGYLLEYGAKLDDDGKKQFLGAVYRKKMWYTRIALIFFIVSLIFTGVYMVQFMALKIVSYVGLL
jgi:glycopeptide antibiotics resistance protein